MSSANWAQVPGGKGLASIVLKFETTGSSFSIQDKTASIRVPDFLRIGQKIFWQSLSGFVQWSKVSRQEWKGREPTRVGRGVTGLRTSQGDIVRPGFSISTIWYLRILWTDIHKWPQPFRSCFPWWLIKIVCCQKRAVKYLLSGPQRLQDFEGREASLRQLDQASWMSKLQAGAQVPAFELTLPKAILSFLWT